MAAQHKRPDKAANLERQRRVKERTELRKAIVVHLLRRWDPERYDGVSPGQCVTWADGGALVG
ncbi:hypothetical protein [Desulfoscipio gibsoniae]|uniref:Uncharacterized protein n=1 Tax=Desulfoscipio gibsoniae DSM 7213 TaxID=767817 RepID=R4KD91_9FIRM|nr:hypothetical protein [Desulfoscipio gibsoniae]AGL01153.1 hypothetical protein Desgi_1683 [Desulfoscipio gibsoniae DSM 7213]